MSNTKPKHTPGPWAIETVGIGPKIAITKPHKSGQYSSTIVETLSSSLEDEANARLIASAPDAVELAAWLLNYLGQNTLGTIKTEHGVGTVVDRHLLELKLNAFLTKATGGAE